MALQQGMLHHWKHLNQVQELKRTLHYWLLKRQRRTTVSNLITWNVKEPENICLHKKTNAYYLLLSKDPRTIRLSSIKAIISDVSPPFNSNSPLVLKFANDNVWEFHSATTWASLASMSFSLTAEIQISCKMREKNNLLQYNIKCIQLAKYCWNYNLTPSHFHICFDIGNVFLHFFYFLFSQIQDIFTAYS